MSTKRKPAAHNKPKRRTDPRTRRIILAVASVLGAFAVLLGCAALWLWSKLDMVDYDHETSVSYPDSLPPEEDDDPLPEGESMVEFSEPKVETSSGVASRPDNGLSTLAVRGNEDGVTNILLLGIDAESGYSGRADVMMLLSINKNTKTIKMISFLRDTLITIPGRDRDGDGLDDYAKLNAAYAYGGFDLLQATMRENFRLQLDKYIGVNFPAFAACVDAMGGVSIALTTAECPYVGIPANEDGSYTAGTYHLTGEQALSYARIRKLDSDFGRTNRQRKLVSALIAKAKGMSVGTLNNVLNAVLGDMRTNMSKTELAGFLLDAATYGSYTVDASYYVPQNGAYQGVSVPGVGSSLQLKAPLDAVSALHKHLYG